MLKLFQTKTKEAPKAVLSGLAGDMTLEQVRAAMLQLMAEENTNHHRMGELYNYMVDNKLAEQAGYKDAKDYFSQNLADLSPVVADDVRGGGADFSEQVARRFGVTCLYLLLTYKEAADLKVNHEEPGTPHRGAGREGSGAQALLGVQRGGDAPGAAAQAQAPSSKPLPAEEVAEAEQLAKVVPSSSRRETRRGCSCATTRARR